LGRDNALVVVDRGFLAAGSFYAPQCETLMLAVAGKFTPPCAA